MVQVVFFWRAAGAAQGCDKTFQRCHATMYYENTDRLVDDVVNDMKQGCEVGGGQATPPKNRRSTHQKGFEGSHLYHQPLPRYSSNHLPTISFPPACRHEEGLPECIIEKLLTVCALLP